jgi:hypothetical protein
MVASDSKLSCDIHLYDILLQAHNTGNSSDIEPHVI